MSRCQAIFYSATHGLQEMAKKALAAFAEDNFVIMGLIVTFCHLITGTSAPFKLVWPSLSADMSLPNPFILHTQYTNC